MRSRFRSELCSDLSYAELFLNTRKAKAMSKHRKHPNAGFRCQGHDYHSRCIYHIVLNKASGLPVFAEITGIPGDHDWAPVSKLTPIGNCIAKAISSLKTKFPFISILRRSIMPDHVHICLFVKEKTDTHLGQIIAELKRSCSQIYQESGGQEGVLFFEDGYYDVFLNGKGQLQKMLAYISDNPRRYLVKKQTADWFKKYIITDGNRYFEAYGNCELLDEYQKVPVKVSRKYSETELLEWKRLWYQTILNDGILVSPFIHPGEKKVKDWAVANGGVLIMIVPFEFTERFKPYGILFELCSFLLEGTRKLSEN